MNAATDVTSMAQRPPYQKLVHALLCIVVVLASYMSTEGKSRTEAKSANLVKTNQSHQTRMRGKHIDSSFNSQEIYNLYKEIESTYYQAAFAESSRDMWRILAEKDGVQVAMMEHPSDPSCPYVRMEIEINVPVNYCWDFLALENWHRTMPKMDPFYEGVELFGEYSHGKVDMILARKRTKRIFAFEKRDFVFLSVSDEPQEDGSRRSATISLEISTIPRMRGYVRAFQDSIAFYKPLSPEKTKITIVCRIDLNDSDATDGAVGNIPMWLYKKTIGISGMKSVVAMRDTLVEERQKQNLQAEPLNGRNVGPGHRFRMPWIQQRASV